ncbi:hypothetical protein N7510_009888 [Penicillium lagena]|uniref:uncharacterized protein n=1 Tax=Penicillium lagena TaxID=94218 RepID=UPI002540FE3D|nr:uncharacterized protein N7510_009888 [Penicillium lagena]KAJ5604734.1 hypothetical protein N7510_009888 [Penicillium lagena]
MSKKEDSDSDEYFNLGTHHRSIRSNHSETQKWFNRGLIWAYAFNHEESATCFSRAIALDPDCAMAYWGLAYAIGPNYNKPWEFFDENELSNVVRRGYVAARNAAAVLENDNTGSAVEKALVSAIQSRYPDEVPSKPCSAWNMDFASAMKSVYESFPHDLDVITIYADALMNTHPWTLWDLHTGTPTDGAPTLQVKKLLDRALALEGALRHPGLLHLYIHLMEMSPSPESALPIADHLRGLVPDGGHLHHMPTHLDMLCGQYQRAIDSNSAAIAADERIFYTLYRAHNYHFRVYAAMFSAQYRVALDTVSQLEAAIPDDLLKVKSPPMADWLEAFLSLRAHVLIRFGRWDDIIMNLHLPDNNPSLYCTTTAIAHYAKGIAFAATGNIEAADHQRHLFQTAVLQVPDSRTLFNNKCIDILAIAQEMLDGEIHYRRGAIEAAFTHLRRAIHLEDNLPYDEPWGWMQPTRHAYGALLLEQGRIQDALDVYLADLGDTDVLPRAMRHPDNVWSLHGARECLRKLGREEEAEKMEGRLAVAGEKADVPVEASCFCRLGSGRRAGLRCEGLGEGEGCH